jgi:hypothetical protein
MIFNVKCKMLDRKCKIHPGLERTLVDLIFQKKFRDGRGEFGIQINDRN